MGDQKMESEMSIFHENCRFLKIDVFMAKKFEHRKTTAVLLCQNPI
jgi:hypothetical protein